LKTILATLYAALPLILLFLAIVFGRKPRL
jgi:hypothetical protein